MKQCASTAGVFFTAAVCFAGCPDAKPFDGGNWREDRIRRGLIPEPTADEFAKAKVEWDALAENRADLGPSPEIGCANESVKVSATRYWVSPCGNDANDGSERRPFATLSRAQEAIRQMKRNGLPEGGVTVFLQGGRYQMSETIACSASDSGEPGKPILYCAAPGERPVFDGGFRVTAWQDVTDLAALKRIRPEARRHVKCADVRSLGFRYYGSPGPRGFEVSRENTGAQVTDLYVNGVRQHPAIWPKVGWLRMTGTSTNHVIGIELDDWTRWEDEPNLLARMYPACYWADLMSPVLQLDPAARTMTITGCGGARKQRCRKGLPYRFMNALAALDREGEWYCDYEKGLVYVWMPERGFWHSLFGDGDEVVLSDFSKPFVRIEGLHDVEFRGLSFRYGRGDAILAKDCHSVTFSDCEVFGFGQNGLFATGMKNFTVDGCVFCDIGYIGARIFGGDRKALTSAVIVVQNSKFTACGNWKRNFAQALCLDGCGAHVRWNLFRDIPGAALRFNGNDFLFASNVIERCVNECGDNGALDIYANPTYAMRIVHNLWRDIGTGEPGFVEAGQAAIRFDDAVSNQIVYGNRFENCSPTNNVIWGFGTIQINGGRNNTIENNLFLGGWRVISIAGWPQSRWEKYMANERVYDQMHKEVRFDSELYRTRYPGIEKLKVMPLENRFYRNIVSGSGRFTPFLGGHSQLSCNFAYRKAPTGKQLRTNPVWDPLPSEAALGPRK